VGKTSLLTRFARGEWTDTYKKTIGTDFMEKEIFVSSTGENIKLMLWDTAGQEMFSELTRNYYKGAGAVVYMFSTVDRASFLEVERWQQKVEAECGKIASVLVQNKIDLLDEASVKKVEVEDLASRMGVKLYRACVKSDIMVNEIFEYVAELFLNETLQSHHATDVQPVADIRVGSPVSHAANVAQPVGPKTGSGGSRAARNNTRDKQESFKLEPSKRRTGGKKSKCIIL
jgi:Ras-related protein Rab-23